jgi:glycine/D-amino acid oxidase-like deaminating enzyme
MTETVKNGDDDQVAVIGAGTIGLSVAWNLVKRGIKVAIYDPNSPGSGCSAGSAGAISPGSVVPLAMPGLLASVPGMMLNPASSLHIPVSYWLKAMPWLAAFVAAARPARVRAISTALAELYRPALDHHRALLGEIGALDLIRTTGQLHLYRNQKQFRRSRGDWAVRSAHDVKFEIVDRGDIDALEPQVGKDYQIGVFIPGAGMSVNPHRHAATLGEALARAGGEFVRERVTRLEHSDRSITGLVTAAGTVRHRRIVVAAGAWSGRLLETIGYQVPLESQRGYHVDFKGSGISLSRPIVPADRKVFITPMETGLRVAGTVEIAGLDAPPTEERARMLYADLIAAIPSARTDDPDPFWMGHRPCLPDSMPVIGASEVWSGLYFAFGHGHLGLTASAVTGSLVGSVVADETPLLDMSPYRIERF